MPTSTPTLRDMIQGALDRGQTYEQLEKRAIDPQTKEPVSRSMMNNIVNRKVGRMPYDYHLRAIAAALEQPYETVRRAAIAQWLPADVEGADNSAVERALLDQAKRLEREAEELRRLAGGQPGPGESAAERETA